MESHEYLLRMSVAGLKSGKTRTSQSYSANHILVAFVVLESCAELVTLHSLANHGAK